MIDKIITSKGDIEMSHATTVSRKRRVVSFLLAAFLIVPMLSPVKSHAASFTDTKGHWAEAYIERAVAQGVIKGYPDGRFEPNKQVSRSEFVSMLNRALGNNGVVSIGFTDVAPTAWYYPDVRKAVSASYVSGYSDGTFKPNNNISRQEAAVMIARILPTYGESGRLQNFTDYRSIADWAFTALSKVNGKGYISGFTDGKIHPLDPLTRAQAAKIIGDIIEEETIITTDPLVKRADTRLSGRIYSNNVTIHSDLANGSATLDNCVVLGSLIVQGGGTGTVTVNNSRVANARVEKDGSPVRLLAKGETSIVNTTASKEGILQTSTLSGGSFGPGFENVNLATSSNYVLRGSFPNVAIVGSSADLTLESGSITSLTVGSGGRRSDITVESGASISNVSVYAESYFHGTGTISTMNVYANNVTYETRPRAINVGSGGSTPEKVDPRLAVTFDPLNGETDVYIDTKIVITFNTAMVKANGNTIVNADLPSLIKLRRGSATGTSVAFTGTINAAKTVMTLTPSANLDPNIKYYVVIDKEVMRNSNGTYNEAISSNFTTGTKTEKLTVTYSPANNTTDIPVDVSSLTITFSDAVTRADGSTVTDSYLKSNVIRFEKGTTSISSSDYTVTINSSKTVVTIRPSASLAVNTKYNFGIKASTLKTVAGTAVSASVSTFTTAATPTLTNTSTTSYETSLDFRATSSVNGTLYAVVLTDGSTAPTVAEIKAGTGAAGVAAIAKASGSTTAKAAKTLSLTGLETDTAYKIFAVAYDGAGNASAVTSVSERTSPLLLKSLTVQVGTGDNLINFQPTTKSYSVSVPYGTTEVAVTALPNKDSFLGTLTISGVSDTSKVFVPLTNSSTVIKIEIQESDKTKVTYTVTVTKIGSTGFSSVTINGTPYEPDVPYALASSETNSVDLVIIPEDPAATVWFGGVEIDAGEVTTVTFGDQNSITFRIRSSEGSVYTEYRILFTRP